MVKTLHFLYRGHGLNPCQRTKIPQKSKVSSIHIIKGGIVSIKIRKVSENCDALAKNLDKKYKKTALAITQQPLTRSLVKS